MGARREKRRRTVVKTEDNRIRNILIAAAVVLGIGALGFLLYLNVREPPSLDGLRQVAGLPRAHDEQVDYSGQELPPVGGIHSGIWQNCGIYDQPVDAKHAVHSMEHGAVWVTYHPELPGGEVETLQDTVRGQPFVLLSPYPELKSPIVMTAWGIQLELDSAGDSRIDDFIDRYQRGPQTPEPGAPCSDGTGSPLS
jgi:hypothetical protein